MSPSSKTRVRDLLVQHTPAPLSTSARTLTGQTGPTVLSHRTWGISSAPWNPRATLRSTDCLLRRQHTTTAHSSTKAMLTKPAPPQSKSVFWTNNNIIINRTITTEFMGWDLPGYLLCCCSGEVSFFFTCPCGNKVRSAPQCYAEDSPADGEQQEWHKGTDKNKLLNSAQLGCCDSPPPVPTGCGCCLAHAVKGICL